MEPTCPQLNAAPKPTSVLGNEATLFSKQMVALTKQADIDPKWKANYWQVQYEWLLPRESAIKAQVASHEATIRDLKQRLYGKKSEKVSGSERIGETKPTSRKQSQQPSRPGHGRSDRSALPVVDEIHDLDATACYSSCREPFCPFPGAEESSIIEIHVQAHRRQIYRPHYQKRCGCPGALVL